MFIGENEKKRIKVLEEKMERKEKEDRKRNIIIKEVKVKERKGREAVEEIMRFLGVKVEVEEVRGLKEKTERDTGIIWVRLRNEE